METQTRDLWPTDISVVDLRTPVSILREQASYLGQKTKNLVEAEVVTTANSDLKTPIAHSFVLVAPALDNYRYQLLRVAHPVEMYPLNIYSNLGVIKADTEDEFTEQLRKLLSSDETKKVIRLLIAQSQR